MDNHRAALWCWLDFYKKNLSNVGIFHIDRHTDTLQSNLPSWVLQASSPLHVASMDINTYLSTVDADHPPANLFRWDNYLSIFLNMYETNITCCNYAAYEGDEINHPTSIQRMPWDIPENIDYWCRYGKWILNIDLDYFFHRVDDSIVRMYSDEYLFSFFKAVNSIGKRDSEVVVTICLSPECCGNWAAAEKVWKIAESCLNTGLELPR